jgi:hypothetical protein
MHRIRANHGAAVQSAGSPPIQGGMSAICSPTVRFTVLHDESESAARQRKVNLVELRSRFMAIRILAAWAIEHQQGHREARPDRKRHQSSAPDDLQEPRRQDETRRTADLGHSSDGPSWIHLAEIRVSRTESRLEAYLNRLLQQNLPISELGGRARPTAP